MRQMFVLALILCGIYESMAQNKLADTYEVNDEQRTGKMGLDSTRSVLADIAREMVTRSATNSQVLSLNLTNLLILVVLKVVVFGAGMFGFNFLNKGVGVIRRAEDSQFMSELDILLLLSYLMGDARHQYECLHRVACEEPEKAKEYVVGAKMMMKGAKFFNNIIPYNTKYETIVSEVQHAVDFGVGGGKCETKYKCSKKSR